MRLLGLTRGSSAATSFPQPCNSTGRAARVSPAPMRTTGCSCLPWNNVSAACRSLPLPKCKGGLRTWMGEGGSTEEQLKRGKRKSFWSCESVFPDCLAAMMTSFSEVMLIQLKDWRTRCPALPAPPPPQSPPPWSPAQALVPSSTP